MRSNGLVAQSRGLFAGGQVGIFVVIIRVKIKENILTLQVQNYPNPLGSLLNKWQCFLTSL